MAETLNDSLHKITNFHFVSKDMASSGLIALDDYSLIKQYGFKHVINLIPGDQTEERNRVQSLGLSYQQIEVDWHEPSLEDFENFVSLMKSYGKDKIYVHCEANYRASTFLYLYRIIELKVPESIAEKDLLKIWTPSTSWADYIEKVKFDKM
ncbi:MAG: protein tyrosine phosphatase family protein [Enterobacterales bacterium]|nr:protein tyrosine phosphatase family protein [Enterobacterales bacterium]